MSDPRAFFSDAYFNQFHTRKYRNPNPFQRRQIARLLGQVVALAAPLQPKTILDAGAGEGFLTGFLVHAFPQAQVTAVDRSAGDLALLRKRLPTVKTIERDLEQLDLGRQFDLLVATEVLEHLPHPAEALRRFSSHAPHLIITVPDEPLFRLTNFLRGKNLPRLGNDPEHLNHWSSRSLQRFLGTSLIVERIERVFPWLIAAGHLPAGKQDHQP